MILADTSVWIAHLRGDDPGLEPRLLEGGIYCHPFIVGELACGNLSRRGELLSLLGDLPAARLVEPEEALTFIESQTLFGRGLGYVDVHLLASARLSRLSLWTLDRRLAEAAASVGVG